MTPSREGSKEVENPWKEGGVYLITGGAGGLGIIFAQEIATKAKGVTLVLTGRSELSGEKQKQLQELETKGAQVRYRQVDVTDRKAVENLVQGIKEECGGLNGIIHCAGVIRDSYIVKKTKEELDEVLGPKVTGLVNLDGASKNMELDFFILFSSESGVTGNPGQADYAAANAFMDGYARYRNQLVALRQRQGKTVAINWPLWKEGGMRVDAETEKMWVESTGMVAMRTGSGILALNRAVASGKDRVMVWEGNPEKLREYLFGKPVKTEVKAKSSVW